jgi:hypothetical protein
MFLQKKKKKGPIKFDARAVRELASATPDDYWNVPNCIDLINKDHPLKLISSDLPHAGEHQQTLPSAFSSLDIVVIFSLSLSLSPTPPPELFAADMVCMLFNGPHLRRPHLQSRLIERRIDARIGFQHRHRQSTLLTLPFTSTSLLQIVLTREKVWDLSDHSCLQELKDCKVNTGSFCC